MSVIHSLFSAFLMYSRIPMPQVEWKEENRRYALCFFPLIGCVIGALLLLWFEISRFLSVHSLLFAAVCTAIPIAVTGGIHLDGFCDVCDAKASCASKERKLEIMSDSRIGAFAAIHLALYLLLQTGVFSQVKDRRLMTVCALCFVLSRALSGLAAVTFRSAKREGALQQFSRPAHRTVTVAAEALVLCGCAAAMLCVDSIAAIGALLGAALTFLYYRIFSYKTFGGITGDLAGYFLQLCELAGFFGGTVAHLIGGSIA